MSRRAIVIVAVILLAVELAIVIYGGRSRSDEAAQALQQALALGEKGEPAKAMEKLLSAAERYPSSSRLLRELSRVEDDLGMQPKALEHLEKAFRMGERDYGSCSRLFILYEFLGKRREARALLEEVKSQPGFPLSGLEHLKLELLLNEASYDPGARAADLAEAEKILREIRTLERPDGCGGVCTVSAAEFDWLSGDYQGAIENFERAVARRISPMALRIDALASAAQLHLEEGHRAKAIAAFEALVREIDAWKEPTYLRLSPVREVALISMNIHYGRKFSPELVQALFSEYDSLMTRGFQDPFRNRQIREIAVAALSGDRGRALLEKCESVWEHHGKATLSPGVQCFYARNLIYSFMTVNLGIVTAECLDRLGLHDKAREKYRALYRLNPRDPVVKKRVEE